MMNYYNIVFENDKDDVDVIRVPDIVAHKMDIISKAFIDWLPNAKSELYWIVIDGRRCSVCETDGFIEWINSTYCQNSQKAYIVHRNIPLCKMYKSIDF